METGKGKEWESQYYSREHEETKQLGNVSLSVCNIRRTDLWANLLSKHDMISAQHTDRQHCFRMLSHTWWMWLTHCFRLVLSLTRWYRPDTAALHKNHTTDTHTDTYTQHRVKLFHVCPQCARLPTAVCMSEGGKTFPQSVLNEQRKARKPHWHKRMCIVWKKYHAEALTEKKGMLSQAETSSAMRRCKRNRLHCLSSSSNWAALPLFSQAQTNNGKQVLMTCFLPARACVQITPPPPVNRNKCKGKRRRGARKREEGESQLWWRHSQDLYAAPHRVPLFSLFLSLSAHAI